MRINTDLIKQRLNELDASQEDLAKVIGYNGSYKSGAVIISRMMSGYAKNPRVFAIYRIAKAIGVTVEDLVIEEPEDIINYED